LDVAKGHFSALHDALVTLSKYPALAWVPNGLDTESLKRKGGKRVVGEEYFIPRKVDDIHPVEFMR
jgi:hypothetical protein